MKLDLLQKWRPIEVWHKVWEIFFFIWNEMSLAACIALTSNLHVNQQQPHDVKSLLCVSNTVLYEEDGFKPKDAGENAYW